MQRMNGPRDPARIDRMCELLRQLWHKAPDQRMGQLLENLRAAMDPCPIYHQEDDVTERKLTAALAGVGPLIDGIEAARRMK